MYSHVGVRVCVYSQPVRSHIHGAFHEAKAGKVFLIMFGRVANNKSLSQFTLESCVDKT